MTPEDQNPVTILTVLAVLIPFVEYLAVVIAVLMVAVTGIGAVAITRPGAQALVSAFMAYAGFSARKDPPKAPPDGSLLLRDLREKLERERSKLGVPPSPPAPSPPGTALKLQSGD